MSDTHELLSTVPQSPLLKAAPIFAVVNRQLSAGDLADLGQKKLDVPLKALAKIRASHHNLARTLALGLPQTEVAAMTGFCQSRISVLKNDPAFAELLTHYTENAESRHAEVQDVLKNISLDAAGELRDRLLDTPEEMSNGFLLKLMESGLDRTGHGTQSNVNVNVAVLNSEDLNEAKNLSPKSPIYSKAERLSENRELNSGRTFEHRAGVETEET